MPIENISKVERILSTSVGARLILLGVDNLKKKPFPSVFKMLLGGFLVYRGYSGYCPANDAIGLNTNGKTLEEAIDIYLDTSVPAKKVKLISNTSSAV